MARSKFVGALLLVCFCLANATIYLQDSFADGEKWRERWVESTWKKNANPEEEQAGQFQLSAGTYFGDAKDVGLLTSDDFRFFTISTKFSKPFKRKGASGAVDKDLVVQYSIKNEQKWIECGGGYIKLLPAGLDQAKFSADSQDSLTFGPDLCGTETRSVLVTPRADGRQFPLTKEIHCESDRLTHFYTLIIRKDDTYEVRIDGEKKEEGSLSSDFGLPDTSSLQLNTQDLQYLGIEIWQVRAGTLFDNFLVTDSIADAEAALKKFDDTQRQAERAAFESMDKQEQDEEENVRRQIEEERARQEEELSRRAQEATDQVENPTPEQAEQYQYHEPVPEAVEL